MELGISNPGSFRQADLPRFFVWPIRLAWPRTPRFSAGKPVVQIPDGLPCCAYSVFLPAMTAKPNRKTRGFTLIEMLVVVAVIALLAAFLFPVFAQARAKARQTVCLSNLRQIGLAVEQYASDYDDTLMPGILLPTSGPNGDPLYAGWAGACNTYAHAPGIFRCPASSAPDTGPAALVSSTLLSYFFNLNLGGAEAPAGLPRARLAAPAATVLVAETSEGLPGVYVPFQQPGETISPFANAFAATVPSASRHQGGRCFLLADGHVKWLRPETVSVGTVAQAASPLALPPDTAATFGYR